MHKNCVGATCLLTLQAGFHCDRNTSLKASPEVSHGHFPIYYNIVKCFISCGKKKQHNRVRHTVSNVLHSQYARD